MLHWAKSFAVIAVVASFAALIAYPSPAGAIAVFLTAVFVTLAILSLITGALGKRRDGTYSAERALALAALTVGAVLVLRAWINEPGRGTRDAGLEQHISSLVPRT